MAHLDEDELLHAAGGGRSPDVSAHLASCAGCRTDLDTIALAGRAFGASLESPPSSVWDAIAAELDAAAGLSGSRLDGAGHDGASANGARLGGAGAPNSAGPHTPLLGGDRSRAGAPEGNGAVGGFPIAGPQFTGPQFTGRARPFTHGSPREWAPGPAVRVDRRKWPVLVAAAVGLLVGSAVTVVVLWGRPGAATPAPEAAAALSGPAATGSATVERDGDARVLTLSADGLRAGSGYFAVWLIDAEGERMYSLGVLTPGAPARLALPPGLSLDEFGVVDVSLQEFNGDPRHSKTSVLRGSLG